MGVLDGQPVNATITNAAFLEKNQDSTGIGRVTLANTDPATGATVNNLQKEHNSAASFAGKALNSAFNDLPAWTMNEVGTGTDSLFARGDALSQRFNVADGHKHDGNLGGGQPISAGDLTDVPLRGYFQQGIDILGVTGSSSDVSVDFAGKTSGGSDLIEGVVTDPPWNKGIVRQASGSNQDDVYKDASGNIVYCRLTESGGTWTLSYFVDVAGVQTAYSFAVASDVRYYYQEIYNPLTVGAAPTYSELAFVPSDNATADVITATTTLQGKVSLSAAAPGAIASSGAAGIASASVANADHTHEGVHSVKASGYSQILGDAIIAGSNGAVVTQAASTITVDAPALSSTVPQDVAVTSTIGVGTTSARADHTHRGVHSVAKSGSSALYGDVTITGSAGVTITQALQNIDVSAPALSSTAPADVGSSASIGSGTTAAKSDHVHRGIFSVHKNGGAQLFGEVTLSQSGGVTITQSSNDLSFDAPALSSTAPADVGSSASIGSGTTSAKSDHVHRGVFSVHKNGSAQLFGDVTLSAGSNITITQAGQDLSIAATGGGGGGGSLIFHDTYSPEIMDGPSARYLNRGGKYAFDPSPTASDFQVLNCDIRVPTSYTAGNNITLKVMVYTPATSGTVAFQVYRVLVRNGVNSYLLPVSAATSNVSVAASATANRVETLSVTIAPSGNIGASAVAAGDLIRLAILNPYPAHTVTSVTYVITSACEVTFS